MSTNKQQQMFVMRTCSNYGSGTHMYVLRIYLYDQQVTNIIRSKCLEQNTYKKEQTFHQQLKQPSVARRHF